MIYKILIVLYIILSLQAIRMISSVHIFGGGTIYEYSFKSIMYGLFFPITFTYLFLRGRKDD